MIEKFIFNRKVVNRIVLLILGLSWSLTSSAGMTKTVIYNMNERYDIELTYIICEHLSSDTGETQACSESKSTLIKAKKFKNDKNYAVISLSQIPRSNVNRVVLYVVSSAEKDDTGNVIAKTVFYDFVNNKFSDCIGFLFEKDRIYKGKPIRQYGGSILEMNDMYESPNINCKLSTVASFGDE